MRHMKILVVITGVLACALFNSGLAQAGDVYKYVDERGTTLYTDKPIPGAILVSTGSQRPPEVAQRNYAANQAATNSQLNASNQRITDSQDNSRVAATVAKDLEASRAERCKKARETYNSSISSHRMYRTGKNGEREYLSEAELAQQRMDAARAVEAICGPQG
ncbi:MAG TPA: DUF4124 domain-containing protein [Steroidobacteraceae bacterium]|nr:DUF4124 domain-containing protein [Steroidobacteraceae bacterium]